MNEQEHCLADSLKGQKESFYSRKVRCNRLLMHLKFNIRDRLKVFPLHVINGPYENKCSESG